MPTGYAMCPWVAVPGGRAGRPWIQPYAVYTFASQINVDQGASANISLPAGGSPPMGYCWVKIRASAATLQAIKADPQVDGFSATHIDDSLGSATQAQRNALRNRLLFLRYTDAEITAALGDLTRVSVRQYVEFAAQRKTNPRMVDINTVAWDMPDVPQDPADIIQFIDSKLV